MSKGSLRNHRTGQPKTRSLVALDSHERNSAGVMGGGKKQKVKRDRQNTDKALREGTWDSL